MTQDVDVETTLRRSLDAVDRHKRRVLAMACIVGVFMVWQFLQLGHAMRSANDVPRMLQLSVVTLIFWTSCLAFVIVLQLSVMTRRVLRAIELSSRGRV